MQHRLDRQQDDRKLRNAQKSDVQYVYVSVIKIKTSASLLNNFLSSVNQNCWQIEPQMFVH